METAASAVAEPVAIAIEAEPVVAIAGSVAIAAAVPELSQDEPTASAIATVEVAGDMSVAADAGDEAFLDETVLDEAVLGEVALEDAILDQTVVDETVLDEAVVDEAGLDADGLDAAVLDMVALAMAAPDPDGEIDYSIADPDEVLDAPRAALPAAVGTPEPAAPHMQVAVAQAAPPPAPHSIGSALLANGFLEQHRVPANDPLAPIRRMSQAEKIAFFS
jgi:hypothetical protein